jgi:Fic family protein
MGFMDLQAFQDTKAGKVMRVPGQDYWAYYPAPLPPRLAWTTELIITLSKADSALGELKGLGHNLANPHLLIAPFIRHEAVLSSRIEGTQASLSDLYAYEAVQLSMFSHPTDVEEVHNYVRALQYGLERLKTLPLSLRLIRELHAHLMEGVRGEHQTPGEFRRSQNWIGPPGCLLDDATFVPPPPEETHAALRDLEAYLHAKPTLPPLIRLGLIHYQFEAIHPFLDGNGRVGRLLIVLLLCAWELLPQPLLYLSPTSSATAKRTTSAFWRLASVARGPIGLASSCRASRPSLTTPLRAAAACSTCASGTVSSSRANGRPRACSR